MNATPSNPKPAPGQNPSASAPATSPEPEKPAPSPVEKKQNGESEAGRQPGIPGQGLEPQDEEVRDESPQVTRGQKIFSAVLLGIFLVSSILIAIRFDFKAVTAFIEANPSLTVVLSLAVFTLFSLTLIPSLPLIAFLSVFIGPLRATLTAGIGMTFAALIEYFIGTQIDNLVNMQQIRRRMPKGLRNLPVDSWLFLTVSRFLPTGPKPVNFLAGSLHISLFTYIWTALLTNYLGAAISAFSAAGLIHLPGLYQFFH